MKRLVTATVIFAGFAVLAIATTALATSGMGVTSTAIGQGNVSDMDVRVKTGDWKLQLDTKGDLRRSL